MKRVRLISGLPTIFAFKSNTQYVYRTCVNEWMIKSPNDILIKSVRKK